jgi:hypothetical protein
VATLQPGEQARMYALGNVARGGATRGGYVSSQVFIAMDGEQIGWGRPDPDVGTIIDSLTITDELDETPNTCQFRVNGAVPASGAEVVMTLGSMNRLERLFAGFAMNVTQLYAANRPANVQANVSAADYTWFLSFLKVTKRYRNLSATAIVQDLVATYAAANGFTTKAVRPNLPVLDDITFTNDDLHDCITRVARRIGGYWFCDYLKDVHLFFEEVGNGAPIPLTPTHPSLAHFTQQKDRSQVLTRVYVEGRGSRLLSHVTVGDTMIPLEAIDMFTAVAPDVFLKLSYQGAEGGAQHLNYSGYVIGMKGSIVGPGIGPASAPTLALVPGAGVDTGTHGYAVTFTTASGESLASPVASIATAGQVPNPSVAATATQEPPNGIPGGGSYMTIGDDVTFAYTYATDVSAQPYQQTLGSPTSPTIHVISNNDPLNPTNSAPIRVGGPHTADTRVKWLLFYVWSRLRNQWSGFEQAENNPQLAGQLATASTQYGDYGAIPYPASNTTPVSNRVQVSNIPTGAATVTGRKLYRTAANQSQLKFLATLANNTATTHLDTAADATLGANVPTTDTSGLQQPDGQVVAGSTTMIVAGTGNFNAGGGWAIIGNGEQVIRYTGVTASSLIGIPASGIGSVTATVVYNSTITAAPMLTGIPTTGPRAITTTLTSGDEVYLVVQVDDTARQAELAADMGGGNGIREDWVQDRRLSIDEARARGKATLALHPLDTVGVSYTCRDLRTSSGKTIVVDLPAPTSVQGQFKIQRVTIDNFRPYPTQYPTFTVQASSNRFSFEDWLRIIKTKE